MSFRVSPLLLLVFGLTSLPGCVSSGGVVEEVCEEVFSLFDHACSFTVTVPTGGVTLEYRQHCVDIACTWDCGQCTNNCCTWGCGNLFGIPCSGCSKQHCGEVCVPCSGVGGRCGQDCVDVPDTIRADMKTVSLCDLIPASIGTSNALEKASHWCPCMQEAVDYVEEKLVEDAGSGEYTDQTAQAVQAASELFECLVEESRTRTDEAEARQAAELAPPGGKIEWGTEIGLSEYSQIVSAGVLCVVYGECGALTQVLWDIFTRDLPKLGELIRDLFHEYLLEAIIKPAITPVMEAVNGINYSLTKVDDLQADLVACADKVEAEATRDLRLLEQEFTDALESFRSTMEDIEEVYTATDGLLAGIEEAFDVMADAIEGIDGGLVQNVLDLVENGADASIVVVIQYIADHEKIQQVQADLETVFSFVVSFEDRLANAARDMQELEAAAQQALEFDACSIEPPDNFDLSVMWDYLDFAAEKIQDGIDNTLETFELQPGIVSYSSWMDVQLDKLPCTRLRDQSFSHPDCPQCGSVVVENVPEFYACPWSETIPLPKTHIPYIRFVTKASPGGVRPSVPTSKAFDPVDGRVSHGSGPGGGGVGLFGAP